MASSGSSGSSKSDTNSSVSTLQTTEVRSAPLVISSIASLIPIKLDSTNYLLWKSLFEPILRANKLMAHIDGTSSPPAFGSPEFAEWYGHDQTLLSWINSTLSISALPYTIGVKSSKEVWDVLHQQFGASTPSHQAHIRKQMLNLKLGNLSMTEYLHKFKEYSDQLNSCGQQISDTDIVIHILDGLPATYRPFASSIRARSTQIKLDELKSLLLCEEIAIADDISSSEPITALYNQKRGCFRSSSQSWRGNPSRFKKSSSYYTQQQGSSSQDSSRPHFQRTTCQICKKQGHEALDCFQRMNLSYSGRQPPERLAAMITNTHNPLDDSTWFADSGATHHLTSDLANLSVSDRHTDSSNVQVGNGQGSFKLDDQILLWYQSQTTYVRRSKDL